MLPSLCLLDALPIGQLISGHSPSGLDLSALKTSPAKPAARICRAYPRARLRTAGVLSSISGQQVEDGCDSRAAPVWVARLGNSFAG